MPTVIEYGRAERSVTLLMEVHDGRIRVVERTEESVMPENLSYLAAEFTASYVALIAAERVLSEHREACDRCLVAGYLGKAGCKTGRRLHNACEKAGQRFRAVEARVLAAYGLEVSP